MKKASVPIFLFALVLLLLSLAGCGNDSSNSTLVPSTSLLLSGVAEDGPIENARITLRDHENNLLAANNIVTDRDGTFSLQVPAGTILTDLTVVASGGRDRATGVDFTGLEMRSPLSLFPDVTALVISPLTTLVAGLQDQGLPLTVAQERLCEWLALPVTANLTARPSASLDLQRRALLLSKIALEIKATAPDSTPFSRIGTQLLATNTLADAMLNPEVMSALGLDVAAQGRVANLQMRLAAATTVDDAVFIYKREELTAVLAANVRQMLTDSAAFDPLNANYRENLRLLAEATLQAAGSEVIALGGTIPQRIARYILFTYQLRTWENLSLDPAIFAGNLALLAKDSWVAELARSRSLYSAVSPLLPTELPGNDNQKRLTYFYGSDLSPHYQAEQLIGKVFDDAINDAMQLKIIEGKANAGLIDETRAIIATQIVQSEPKAHAYRALANALIKFNRLEEARSALDDARALYLAVIKAHKGAASTITSDVANLLATASSYRKAGDLLNAQSLLADVAVIAQALASDALIYGNLITGIKNVVDAYVAAGDLNAAAPLIDEMHKYAGQTPAYQSSYKLRVLNWRETGRRYADLGNGAMVVQVVAEIQTLRAEDTVTRTATWFYLVDLVESLCRVGETQAAWDLANSIPNDTATNKTYRTSAFKSVATYEALQGNLDKAFTIVDDSILFPKDEDKVDLLTYFAANQKNPYIALTLINAGPARFAEARLALQKAETLLDAMILSNNLMRIRYGYVKVAQLHALMGDSATAALLLTKAEEQMADDLYTVAVMTDIALGYHNLQQDNVALTLLANAQDLAVTDPTRYRADTTPNLGQAEAASLLYEALIRAYVKIGAKDRILATVNLFLSWAQAIHTAGTVDDTLAGKECDYLLRAALYLEGAGDHTGALSALALAKASAAAIAIDTKRLTKYLSVIETYPKVHESQQGLALALSLEFTAERNQAIQTLANAYNDRDDFPDSQVASIDSDGDSQPDFFNPLVSAEEIAASGLLLDDDSDGDGSVDTVDLRPLFVDGP